MKKYIYTLGLILAGCGEDGARGPAGPGGASGTPGQSGQSDALHVQRFTSDTSICPSGSGIMVSVLYSNEFYTGAVSSMAIVCDGKDGSNGADGQDGADAPISDYTVTAVVDPCGDAPGIQDEVFLKFSNGQIIASFSENANGKNTRLSLLTEGNYVTTDGSNCHVHIDSQGNVTW